MDRCKRADISGISGTSHANRSMCYNRGGTSARKAAANTHTSRPTRSLDCQDISMQRGRALTFVLLIATALTSCGLPGTQAPTPAPIIIIVTPTHSPIQPATAAVTPSDQPTPAIDLISTASPLPPTAATPAEQPTSPAPSATQMPSAAQI